MALASAMTSARMVYSRSWMKKQNVVIGQLHRRDNRDNSSSRASGVSPQQWGLPRLTGPAFSSPVASTAEIRTSGLCAQRKSPQKTVLIRGYQCALQGVLTQALHNGVFGGWLTGTISLRILGPAWICGPKDPEDGRTGRSTVKYRYR